MYLRAARRTKGERAKYRTAATPDWIDNLVVELDYCSIDMTEAIRRSYDYLVRSGLGIGNR